MTPTFSATISQGKLKPDQPDLLHNHLNTLEGKRVMVTVAKQTFRRTLPQNKYYFGVVLKLISDYTGEDVDNLHGALKANFAPKRIIGNLVVPSTSKNLDTIEFTEYIEKVRRWAAEELSINIPDPNQVRL